MTDTIDQVQEIELANLQAAIANCKKHEQRIKARQRGEYR